VTANDLEPSFISNTAVEIVTSDGCSWLHRLYVLYFSRCWSWTLDTFLVAEVTFEDIRCKLHSIQSISQSPLWRTKAPLNLCPYCPKCPQKTVDINGCHGQQAMWKQSSAECSIIIIIIIIIVQ